MTISKTTRRLLAVSYSLLDDLAEQEASWEQYYAGLKPNVTGIVMNIPSWQQDPAAINHPLVQTAANAIHADKLDLFLSQDLFKRWGEKQDKWDVMQDCYYVAYLTRLQLNAETIGAMGTAVEVEPYGESSYKPEWFKKTGFTEYEAERVQRAITDALLYTDPADYITPTDSRSPNSYPYAFRGLAKEHLSQATYRARDPSEVKIVTPEGMYPDVHWWGSWVTADGRDGTFSVEEALTLDLPTIQKTCPECGGFWLWVPREDMVSVMQQLAG